MKQTKTDQLQKHRTICQAVSARALIKRGGNPVATCKRQDMAGHNTASTYPCHCSWIQCSIQPRAIISRTKLRREPENRRYMINASSASSGAVSCRERASSTSFVCGRRSREQFFLFSQASRGRYHDKVHDYATTCIAYCILDLTQSNTMFPILGTVRRLDRPGMP